MTAPRAFTKEQYEFIKSTTRYNPEDGTFERFYPRLNKWREMTLKPRGNGYIHICYYFDNETKWFQAHRVAYLLMSGELEFIGIDHVDGNPSNNRWENIRLATPAQNQGNIRALGVYWNKPRKKWLVRLRIDGKQRFLGYYEDKDEAIAAYRKAHANRHKEFSPWFKEYGQSNEVEEVESNMACC